MAKADRSTEPTRATLLLVDDDPEILSMMQTRLGKLGYRILTAADGAEALAQASKERPALVVLDVMMPKMTGWEVARALRQDPDSRSIKILILTAIGVQINEMTSPLYGADAFLDKPFDFRRLEELIAELVG